MLPENSKIKVGFEERIGGGVLSKVAFSNLSKIPNDPTVNRIRGVFKNPASIRCY